MCDFMGEEERKAELIARLMIHGYIKKRHLSTEGSDVFYHIKNTGIWVYTHVTRAVIKY